MEDATNLRLLESFVHITAPPLPYLITAGRSVFRAGDTHENRTLPETFVFILVNAGTLHMHVGGETLDVGPHEFLLLPPGLRHGGTAPCERATMFSWLHMRCDGPVRYVDHPVRQRVAKANKNLYYRKADFPICFPVHGRLDGAQYELMQTDFKEIEQTVVDRYQHIKRFLHVPISEVASQSLFLRILGQAADTVAGHEKSQDLATRVHRYIQDHYTLPLSVRQIARVFSCDTGHLSRVMRARFGMSTLRLLTATRIEAAKRLLVASDDPVADIGRDVGFDTPSYFTKRFREVTGVSPSEYRSAHGLANGSTNGSAHEEDHREDQHETDQVGGSENHAG